MWRSALCVERCGNENFLQRRRKKRTNRGPARRPRYCGGSEEAARIIAREPPFERALLLLYLEEKSQKEIAEILGITPTNVSTKINRLKQRIRTEI